VASVDRVNPIATAAKVQIASPYQVMGARDERRRQSREEDREPHDTVELHEEGEEPPREDHPSETTHSDRHGIDFST
jgi:hypothetical protein